MSENLDNNSFGSEKWNYEAEQNWLGFWDLILKEYIRQNPEEYKKFKNSSKKDDKK